MNLMDLRKQIDEVDREWILLLKRRVDLVKRIAVVKKQSGLPALDLEREKTMTNSIRRQAMELKLDPAYAERLFLHMLAYMKIEMQVE